MKMAKLIMLIGIPGSGKTTYSKELTIKYNAKVISSDKVRQTFTGIDEKDVFPTVYKLCIEELKNGKNVILDATHITPKVRKRSFDALDEYNEKNFTFYFKYNSCFKCYCLRRRNRHKSG